MEHGAVMLIDLAEVLAVVGEQHFDARRPLGAFAPVPDRDPPNGLHLAQVHLPPRVLAVVRVKAPLAVLDAVAAASRVGLGGERLGDRAQQRHFLGEDPVGREALLPGGTFDCQGRPRGDQKEEQDEGAAQNARPSIECRAPR